MRHKTVNVCVANWHMQKVEKEKEKKRPRSQVREEMRRGGAGAQQEVGARQRNTHTVHWPMGNLECKHLEGSSNGSAGIEGFVARGVGGGAGYSGQLPFGRR